MVFWLGLSLVLGAASPNATAQAIPDTKAFEGEGTDTWTEAGFGSKEALKIGVEAANRALAAESLRKSREAATADAARQAVEWAVGQLAPEQQSAVKANRTNFDHLLPDLGEASPLWKKLEVLESRTDRGAHSTRAKVKALARTGALQKAVVVAVACLRTAERGPVLVMTADADLSLHIRLALTVRSEDAPGVIGADAPVTTGANLNALAKHVKPLMPKILAAMKSKGSNSAIVATRLLREEKSSASSRGKEVTLHVALVGVDESGNVALEQDGPLWSSGPTAEAATRSAVGRFGELWSPFLKQYLTDFLKRPAPSCPGVAPAAPKPTSFDTLQDGIAAFDDDKLDAAARLLTKAVELGVKERRDDVTIKAWKYLGAINAKRGQSAKALDCYQKAYGVALDGRSWSDMVELARSSSDACTKMGNAAKARSYQATAEALEKVNQLQNEAAGLHSSDVAASLQRLVDSLHYVKKLGDDSLSAWAVYDVAIQMWSDGYCADALDRYQQAERLGLRKLVSKEACSEAFFYLGACFEAHQDYDATIKLWRKAGALNALELNLPAKAADVSWRLGMLMLRKLGKPKDAAEYFAMARDHSARARDIERLATSWFDLGLAYDEMKNTRGAVGAYRKALEIAEEAKLVPMQFAALVGLASLFSEYGNDEEAAINFKKAEALLEKGPIDDKPNLALLYNSLGAIAAEKNQVDVARKHYEKALAIAVEGKLSESIADTKRKLGTLAENEDHFDQAVALYDEAYKLMAAENRKDRLPLACALLGRAYARKGDYASAERYLKEAIALTESAAKNVGGRDYLNSMNAAPYVTLLEVYARQNRARDAFAILEQTSSRFLRQRLQAQGKAELRQVSVDEFRATLPDDGALVAVTTTVANRSIVLYADKATVRSFGVEDTPVGALHGAGAAVASAAAPATRKRGIKVVQRQKEAALTPDDAFFAVLDDYRALLAHAPLSTGEKKWVADVGRALYDLVFKELEDSLKGKRVLYLVAGSELAYLPFETFVMPDGRYLVEQYDVRYVPSMTVLDLLAKRKYPDDRKSLIAFGNARYDKIEYKSEDERATAAVKGQVAARDGFNNRLLEYIAWGYGPDQWEPLPGTAGELAAIKTSFPDATVVSGAAVSEEQVKKLSSSGDLARYRVVHFATHGVVVPEEPGLSALVLTQKKGQLVDNYLSLDDISSLALKADFVNLSACETGLGRFYLMEGVVGFSQSFLLAGANAVSVSLWSVADESTRAFMAELYEQVKAGKRYDAALSQAKRKLISEGTYAAPFYWAPFVYYGN